MVVISIIGILAALALPALSSALTKGQMTGTLNNMRQLQLATQQMSLDATTTGDSSIGWPGDCTNTEGSVQALFTNMVPTYMQTNDLLKVCSAPGVAAVAWANISGGTVPFNIYAVQSVNPSDTIYLVTKSWAGFAQPLNNSNPYGTKGFIITHMGGDSEIFYNKQALSGTSGGNLGETNGSTALQ